ncbi:EpsG family protein [Sphingomonas mesophila]|uniref:EpsG family protein n=1 Tax=Sphingomonas mesophila TaxID=2303576 RepID=UPI000E594790|nr:EpsG family protein [Sphingomonas mesophila]
MFPYWLLFSLFAIAALTERARPGAVPGSPGAPLQMAAQPAVGPLIPLFLFMALMIGVRFQVGADYHSYINIFSWTSEATFDEAIERGDPGYQFVNWLVGQWDGKMWHVNLICGAIFAWGLMRFCQRQPAPLLAALVAIPYLVTVVAMGYTRQAVAIGVIMAGLASLDRRGSIPHFVIYVGIAALFHRTAIIALPLAIFAGRRNHLLNLIAIVLAGLALYYSLLEESVDTLVKNYIEARYGSQGAAIRVAMNVLPATILLIYSRKLGLTDYSRRFWVLVALVALACVPALFIVPSTTAIDRIALYLIPIQIVVFSRLGLLLNGAALGRLMVVAYSFAILFVWLNFAAHAFAWVPYRTVIEW